MANLIYLDEQSFTLLHTEYDVDMERLEELVKGKIKKHPLFYNFIAIINAEEIQNNAKKTKVGEHFFNGPVVIAKSKKKGFAGLNKLDVIVVEQTLGIKILST